MKAWIKKQLEGPALGEKLLALAMVGMLIFILIKTYL